MYNLEQKRRTVAAGGSAFVLLILAIYVGTTTIGQNELHAQDKSTSITCTGKGPCEKTECVNGTCETAATNSSNISSTTGSDQNTTSDESESRKEKSIADALRERLNTRED